VGLTFAVKLNVFGSVKLGVAVILTRIGCTKITVDAVTDVPVLSCAVTVGVNEPSSP
jgi:hypothetical protein